MTRRKSVAFVSEKNSCRSIIAQAYLFKLGNEHFEGNSFGLEPNRVHYLVREVLEEKGFNMNFYFSKAFEVIQNQKFDIVVTMHPTVTEKLPELPYQYELVEWDFIDPTVKDISETDMKMEIEDLCSAIESSVEKFVEKFKEQN